MTGENPTPEQLAEWKRKTDAATNGPWGVFRAGVDTGAGEFVHSAAECGRADAEFISMAREAMPILLNRVRRAEEALERIADDDHCEGDDCAVCKFAGHTSLREIAREAL